MQSRLFFSLPDIWPRSATLPTRHLNRKRLHTSRLRSFFSFSQLCLCDVLCKFHHPPSWVSTWTWLSIRSPHPCQYYLSIFSDLFSSFFWIWFFRFSRLEILVSRSSPGIRCKSLISCHRNRQRVREIESNCLTKSKPKKGKSPERPRTVIRMIISYSTIAPLMMMSPIVKACLCT